MIARLMTIAVRAVGPDELAALSELDAAIFGYRASPEDTRYLAALFEPARTLCAFDGDEMVASSAALALEVTLPGGAPVRMAGITWVGVRATHRRRGIMRRLLTDHLEALSTTGEPVAGLMASESVLYRRFGFGIASHAAEVKVDPRSMGLRAPVPDTGTLELAPVDAFVSHLDTLATRLRTTRNGMVSRTLATHQNAYRLADQERDGAAPMQLYVHRDATGEVDGLLAFRLAAKWESGFPRYELRVSELIGLTAAAEAALWRLCFEHDLVTQVSAWGRPVDEPIVDLIADPRRWVTRVIDDLHLRPADIPALLSARRYSRDDSIVLEVRDESLPGTGGRFRLDGGHDGAECTRTDAPADIVLGPAELGAVLLGETPLERLARAGLVEERTDGAVWRATAMLRWAPAPWASYIF
jgi:predicted acetyltransferase